MRIAVVAVGVSWTVVCAGQTGEQAVRDLMFQELDIAMLTYRAFPETRFSDFDDPVSREGSDRSQALSREFEKTATPPKIDPPDPSDPQSIQRYFAQMQASSQNFLSNFKKWVRGRVDEAAAQFGNQDPRYAAALEDAGLVLGLERDADAAGYMEKALALREREGPQSVEYWKDLQRQCLVETAGSGRIAQNLKPCERAYEVRATQTDATPQELASRALILATEEDTLGNREKAIALYQQAGEFYEKTGLVPLALAQVFRHFTTVAVATRNVADVARFNDVTNRYLAKGDAKARSLMVASDALTALEEEKRTPESGKAIGARELLAQSAEVEKAIKSGQVSRPVTFDAAAMSVIPFLTDSQYCSTVRSALDSPLLKAMTKSQTASDSNLAGFSATLFANTSMIQHFCGNAGGDQVPGYGLMVGLKGLYTELDSTRKLTSIAGESKLPTAALQAAADAISNPILSQLPANAQRQIEQLPPGERAQAALDYVKAHPNEFEEIKRKGEAAASGLKQLEQDWEANPLAFLELLRDGEAYLDIYRYSGREGDRFGDDRYLAVVSGGGKSRLIQLGPAAPIDSAIDSFLSAIAANGARGVTVAKAEKMDLGKAWTGLGSSILQPLLAALPKGTKHVWISPDSSLTLVPFSSLALDARSPVEISIVPSAYEFARFRNETEATKPGRVLLVGGLDYGQANGVFKRLPGTETEVKAVAELAAADGLQTVMLGGREATRNTVLQQLQGSEWLHLATHGYWSTPATTTVQDALQSAGLALSMANSEAGETRLTAEDIFKLDLSRVRLVTLSACASGEGRPVDGQGLLGFQTAFMAAGVRTVLLSLWSVPDEATSVLMQGFYRALWKTPGISKSAALREAQEQLRSDQRFNDVRNWGAWVLVGDGD